MYMHAYIHTYKCMLVYQVRIHVIDETLRSHISEVSRQVGLLMTIPLYTEVLLPPPSRF